jgi:carbon storage regulator
MLVLSRKKDQRIVIDGNIVICVVAIMGDKVRIGIEAPPEIPVVRLELHNAQLKLQLDNSIQPKDI